uniref:Uncharacterized protein n=1 Tax=Arundo donax TaxID=35708 RepID=A0A0A9CF34_ARUDO
MQALLHDSLQQLLFQGPDLVQDVDNLTTGVWQAKNLFLAKVTVNREDNDVEYGWNSAEELLHVDRIWCLEHFREAIQSLFAPFSSVTPSFLQSPLLKSLLKLQEWRISRQPTNKNLCKEQCRLKLVHRVDGIINHQLLTTVI